MEPYIVVFCCRGRSRRWPPKCKLNRLLSDQNIHFFRSVSLAFARIYIPCGLDEAIKGGVGVQWEDLLNWNFSFIILNVGH